MRKMLFVLLAIASFGCKQEPRKMPGAYKLIAQSVHDGVKDSILTGVNQLKIYTDDQMMYGYFDNDSVSSFGIASYQVTPEGVTETLIYSASGSIENTSKPVYKLQIETTSAGYKQTIDGMESQGKKFRLVEDYESVGTTKTSPLDGTWEMTSRYAITENDTSMVDVIQFKTYYAGYVVWGMTYLDSLKNLHTGIGFGSFEMPSDSKVRETIEVSSFADIRGHLFDIDVVLQGPDEFKQTITEPDGRRSIEHYQRMKN